jgi:ferric-dicitrate binding protein FerR (iron transport regulator)
MDVDEKLDPEAEELLSALEAGELDGAARAQAEALLARSAPARALYERLARLRTLTAALPDPELPAPLVEHDVRTGPGEHRLLQLGDRATAFVGERSVVRVDDAGVPLRILAGNVRFVVRPDKDQPWTIATPAADATVHGTEFDVNVSTDATEVRVARGEVEVRNELGARTLWAGEVARAHIGAAPRRIERLVPIVLEGTPEIHERP